MFTASLLVACLPAFADPPADSADRWVGRRAMLKSTDPVALTRTKADGSEEVVGQLRGQLWVNVVRSDGERLLVRDRWGEGWLAKSAALLPEEATHFYTDRLKTNPQDADALNRRAAAWLELNEPKNADRDATECLRIAPLAATAFNTRGLAREKSGDLAAAIADFSSAIRIGPIAPILFENRGRCHFLTGDYASAANDLGDALKLDPNNPGTLAHHGWAEFQLAHLTMAVIDFDKAIALDPKMPKAFEGRGRARNALPNKDYPKTLADFDAVIRLAPNDAGGYLCKAWVLATAADAAVRKGPEAVKLATTACELSGWGHWMAVSSLAAASAEVGDFEKAVRYQKQAIGLLTGGSDDLTAAKKQLDLYEHKTPFHDQ